MSILKNHDNSAVGFSSTWKETRSYESSECQSEPIKTEVEGTQNIVSSSKEVQTSNDCPIQFPSLSEDEEQGLATFLSRISGNVLKELDKNDASIALARLDALDFQDEEEMKSEQVKSFEPPAMETTKIKVSCVSWNCTGSLLAVGVCSRDHDTWCSHGGLISFYNTEKSAPTRSIKTKSCVTCISMHPYELSLVAAGMYSGEVCTYNLNLEDTEYSIKSNISECSRVTQVSWECTEGSNTRPLLVVSSLDGTMSLFSVTLQTGTMSVVRKLIIRDPTSSIQGGVLCFSFAPRRPHSFVVAVEGGSLYQGSTLDTPADEPILSSLHPHSFNICRLCFSTHTSARDGWFLSVCLEDIRLYELDSPAPLHTIFSKNYCLGVAWSITQPQVIFYWGEANVVTVYNMQRKTEIAQLNVNSPERIITTLDINTKVPSLVAMGNEMGEVQVWQIPKYFKL